MAEMVTDLKERSGAKGSTEWRPGQKPARRVDAEQQSLAVILNLVRTEEANTRLEIERVSGLGRAIVADRIATLIDLGLMVEGELGPASGGRAPRNAKFREQAGLFLVAVLDQSTIGIAISDLSGRLLVEHHEAVDANVGAAQTIKRLETLFDWALEQHREARDIWGIGIAVNGPVEPSEDQPFASPNLPFLPSWEGVPFVELLTAHYDAPVWVRSNTQVRTLGELRAGSGMDVQDMLFVDLDKEISAGIVCDGQLYRGARGGAGMIGHIATTDDATIVCKCGNTGCLEAVASSDAIIRAALQAIQNNQSPNLAEILAANSEITAADVGAAAIMGDSFCAELLSRSGRLIGSTLATLTNSYNPSLIVLGGSLAQNSDILLAAIREAVYRKSHPLVSRDLRIVRSQMGSSSALVGTAFSLVDEIFGAQTLGAWVGFGSPMKHPDVIQFFDQAKRASDSPNHRPMPPVPSTPLDVAI